jgi:ABC-type multidrug transport system ATPase subunit
MLTGLFPPTSGSALVAGYDIATEIEQVHLSMGLCPQFDVLWNDLTVEEHLLFYCRLKGVESSHESEHVKRIMRDVGLHTASAKLASDLSGGMKRRLSIAIALVGHSRIVLLDEPTTGLDPVSRRQIWVRTTFSFSIHGLCLT